ncbi:hypothetical protein VTI74DRAFT_7373 [Chaetomium olivicolor]
MPNLFNRAKQNHKVEDNKIDSDSDFYGDEETVSCLQSRVDAFDILSYWEDRHHSAMLHPSPSPASSSPPDTNLDATRLFNAYASLPGTRRLTESVPSFLARLPPAATDWQPGLDWIWIANPYHPPGPPEALAQFREGGQARLQLFSDFEKMALATAGRTSAADRGEAGSTAMLRRDVAKERRETVEDLKELAGACNIVTGKWMLFPERGNVNEVWGKVATATADGELGVGAKVETRVESGKERLVCVYTRDFRDKKDVVRVLGRMRQLELVRPGERQIYYKSGKLS